MDELTEEQKVSHAVTQIDAAMTRILRSTPGGTIAEFLADHPELLTEAVIGQGHIVNALYDFVRKRVCSHFSAQFRDAVVDAYEMHVLMNGQYEDAPAEQREAWTDAIDDTVQTICDNYNEVLSKSWIGASTVDVRLHVAGELDKLVVSFEREVWTQVTFTKKQPQALLADAGYNVADVVANVVQKRKETMSTTAPAFDVRPYLAPIVAAVGPFGIAGYPNLRDLMDKASGQDWGEAYYAIQAIGGAGNEASIWQALSLFRRDWPVGTAAGLDQLMALLRDAVEGNTAAPAPDTAQSAATVSEADDGKAKSGKGRKPKKDKPDTTPSAAGAQMQTGQTDYSPVLQAFKNACGMKDQDIGDAIGMSRASVNNVMNGKQAFHPTAEQKSAMQKILYDNMSTIQQAYALLS